MAAAAIDVSEQAKLDAYVARVTKRPKQVCRAQAAAGCQTKWVIEAVQEWYEFNYQAGSVPGLPTENVLHRAALLLPRPPLRVGPPIQDPPPRVVAVGRAIGELRESRVTVLIACERFARFGIERAAQHLGMTVPSTKAHLKEARDGLAHVLRGMGWKIPKED